MRVRLLAAIVLPLVAVVVAVLALRGGDGDSAVRVDVVFDSARGIQEGSLVKVAGARVGRVVKIALTPAKQARVSLELQRDLGPFRADASCAIRPEGLIAESFVGCEPGSRRAPVLRGRGGGTPTIPVGQTGRPVNLADLLNLWSLPTGERTRVLISQLGLGLSGKGHDLNEILGRTNPGLQQARRLLAVVDRQRFRLRQTVERTSRVAALLADRRGSLHRMAVSGQSLGRRVARHRSELADAVRRLPALLDQADPALRELDGLSEQAGPLLQAADRSAPGIARLSRSVGPVVRRADRTLGQLRVPLRRTRRASADLATLLPRVDRDLTDFAPTLGATDRTLGALRDSGFFEGLWGFLYYAAAAISRFDSTSHVIAGNILITRCMLYAQTRDPDCSGWLKDDPAARPTALRSTPPAISGGRR